MSRICPCCCFGTSQNSVQMPAREYKLKDYKPEISNEQFASILNYHMPNDPKIEAAVIGGLMMESDSYNRIKGLLKTKEVFYINKHQTIFEAIVIIKTKGGLNSKVDILTVSNQVAKMGLLKKPGQEKKLKGRKLDRYKNFSVTGFDIVNLTNGMATAMNIEHHTRILYELYMRRKALKDSTKVIQDAQNLAVDVFDLYEEINKNSRVMNPSGLLVMKSMNEVMDEGEKEPLSKWVMGNLVKENEVIILFGDEGTGKSILAFQMADRASKGKDLFDHDDFRNHCEPKSTIFYDFELEASELYSRYSIGKEKFNFHKNFKRSSINKDFLEFENADELIINEIQRDIEMNNPEFVVVDNMTYIASESQDPTMATKLMKRLLALQKKYKPLTIIIIAHTPKRDMSMPIQSRHLAGAKNLANFAKSVIAVSLSKQDPDKRYIKHIKCRNGRKMHDETRVVECIIRKEGANLGYEHYGFSTELEHLEIKDIGDQMNDIMDTIVTQRKAGKSFRQISKILHSNFDIGWAHTTIRRKLKEWYKNSNINNEVVDIDPDPVTQQETRETIT